MTWTWAFAPGVRITPAQVVFEDELLVVDDVMVEVLEEEVEVDAVEAEELETNEVEKKLEGKLEEDRIVDEVGPWNVPT